MKIFRALNDIKSHEFAARVSIASDFDTFLRAVQDEESVKVLLQELGEEFNAGLVLREILELSTCQYDWEYANPYDEALTVLLWALNQRWPGLAKAAGFFTHQALQCFWKDYLLKVL